MSNLVAILLILLVLLLFAGLEAMVVLFVIWKIDGMDKKNNNQIK